MRGLCLLVAGTATLSLRCEADKRRFKVRDDIEWSQFGDLNNGQTSPVTFSPDGSYFVVHTEKGVLETNRSKSTLRVYRTRDVHRFLLHGETDRRPSPIWTLSKSTYKDGPIITHIAWLRDSSGFAFLAASASGNRVLFLADLKSKTDAALTPEDQSVLQFDVGDQMHFVYAVESSAVREFVNQQSHPVGLVGTGRSLPSLLFPRDITYAHRHWCCDLAELWAVVGEKRFQVMDKSSGRPFPLHNAGVGMYGPGSLKLSPDGRSAVAIMAVRTVPDEWKELYRPPNPSSAIQIRTTGEQDLWALDGRMYISQYVVIDLKTGEMKPLTNAPTGYRTSNWEAVETAAWSSDGRSVVLSNTLIPAGADGARAKPNPPCVTVVDIATGNLTCVERIEGGFSSSKRFVADVAFGPNGGKEAQITVTHRLYDGSTVITPYLRADDGSWSVAATKECVTQARTIDVTVKEDLNDPPVLVATDNATKVSRVLWDPNPQFKDIDLGEASILEWKDSTGRRWVGGLYKPPDYVNGSRYPLVVQTHGFLAHQFRPSGLFPTGFAARELAAAGIMVLQVPDCAIIETREEGPCKVAGYESGVQKLEVDGLVDADRIVITCFSRSCFYVMETLTKGNLRLAAASITEGYTMGYIEYLKDLGLSNNFTAHTVEAALGVPPPFGEGIQQWIKHSPEFNLDKVFVPLQVVAADNHYILLGLWQPYAILRLMHRPVDLIILVL